MVSRVRPAYWKAKAGGLACLRVAPLFAGAAALVWLALAPLASAQPFAACAKPGEDVIAGQFDRWNHAVATGNPDAVVELYAENAVLRVAGQPAPIIGRPAIRAYFTEFLARRPQGALSMRSISVSCNAASDTGAYVYRLTGRRKGTRMLITGRYSTFYEYRDGDWLIVRHQG